jgi:chromate reductase, NAD(P)H dehydrogenase (quinone)
MTSGHPTVTSLRHPPGKAGQAPADRNFPRRPPLEMISARAEKIATPISLARQQRTAMDARWNVAVLVGSLRKESFNRKMANAVIGMAPPSLALEIIEIRNLPLYNQDDDADPSAASAAFKARIQQADAALFVTPEYNRSVPGVLKNAIDIASRPYGKSAWNGKPAGVISVSPGAIGAFGANHHLRQSLVFLNMPALQQPEAYIGGAAGLFDEQGKLVNDSTRDFLKKFLDAFVAWIGHNAIRQ